jgi:hypothetical protein
VTRAVRWVAAALVALVGSWLLAPAAVPIYDGIGNPDQPYRYVHPPAGYRTTPAATDAHAVVAVAKDVSQNAYANSKEIAPQVSVYFPTGALRAPSGATTIDVVATPTAPAPPSPKDGQIVGNVYRITATAGGDTVDVVGTGRAAPTLQMRAPSGKLSPVFEHRTASGWEQVHTARIGFDIYQTAMPALGDWALVQPSDGGSSGSGGGVNVGLLAGGIAVIVVAGLILLIRTSRTRRAA